MGTKVWHGGAPNQEQLVGVAPAQPGGSMSTCLRLAVVVVSGGGGGGDGRGRGAGGGERARARARTRRRGPALPMHGRCSRRAAAPAHERDAGGAEHAPPADVVLVGVDADAGAAPADDDLPAGAATTGQREGHPGSGEAAEQAGDERLDTRTGSHRWPAGCRGGGAAGGGEGWCRTWSCCGALAGPSPLPSGPLAALGHQGGWPMPDAEGAAPWSSGGALRSRLALLPLPRRPEASC